MNILLLGEYSRLHNSLKEGLKKNGHTVTLVGNGDGFKKYAVDINIEARFTHKTIIIRQIQYLIKRLTNFDLATIEKAFRFYLQRNKFKNHDVVQLINEHAIGTPPWIEKRLLNYIFKHNKNIFLLTCGDDYNSISYYLEDKTHYSILTPYLKNKQLKKYFYYSLKYATPAFKKLHDFVFQHIKGVIPTDFDYVLPIAHEPLAKPIIPNPINIDLIKYDPREISDKIVIFHGVNTSSSIKKGNQYFTEALEIISKNYGEKIEIITTYSLPYKEYIKHYQRAHILLDQVFSYDQGYNALEAMAVGKVVFTGAEQEFTDYYGLKDSVAINALPDAIYIAKQLEYLIQNPSEIIAIGKRARKFIEKEHDYIKIAQKYESTWLKD